MRKFLHVFEGELTFLHTIFDGTRHQLHEAERSLLDAMMPAYSDSGFSADVRAPRGGLAETEGPLFLPALQGSFGDRTYYSALVRLGDLVERVHYATLLQSNNMLADQIQRRLDDKKRAE